MPTPSHTGPSTRPRGAFRPAGALLAALLIGPGTHADVPGARPNPNVQGVRVQPTPRSDVDVRRLAEIVPPPPPPPMAPAPPRPPLVRPPWVQPRPPGIQPLPMYDVTFGWGYGTIGSSTAVGIANTTGDELVTVRGVWRGPVLVTPELQPWEWTSAQEVWWPERRSTWIHSWDYIPAVVPTPAPAPTWTMPVTGPEFREQISAAIAAGDNSAARWLGERYLAPYSAATPPLAPPTPASEEERASEAAIRRLLALVEVLEGRVEPAAHAAMVAYALRPALAGEPLSTADLEPRRGAWSAATSRAVQLANVNPTLPRLTLAAMLLQAQDRGPGVRRMVDRMVAGFPDDPVTAAWQQAVPNTTQP
jgi:hypothetical protein